MFQNFCLIVCARLCQVLLGGVEPSRKRRPYAY